MIKFLQRFKQNIELEKENEELKLIISELKNLIGNPLEEMKFLLGRPIKWIDTDGMDFAKKKFWYDSAQIALGNPVVQSLLGKTENGEAVNGEIAKDLIEHIAKSAENFEQVSYYRSKLAGVEMLRQYLNDISDPSENVTKKDLHSVI